MICNRCGNTINDNSAVCPACGSPVAPPQPNPYAQQNPYAQPNPYSQPNPYVQPNPYAQQCYGAPAFFSQQAYSEFNKKATDLRTFGILATVLMFGIGLVFSIIIWISGASLKEPVYPPQSPQEAMLLEEGRKKLKTARILAIMPIVGLVLSFFVGIIIGMS